MSSLFYFNKDEKVYKVFDPVSRQWSTQPDKPTPEQIEKLQSTQLRQEIAQPEEQKQPLTEEELKRKEARKLKRKRAQQNKKKKWYEARNNTFVYASGLPADVTEDEVVDFFMKCGVLKIDPATGKKKVKIYTDDEGRQKGDVRVCYENIESVEMAIEWLSDSEIRPGFKVHVEQAVFEQKGETYVPKEAHKLDKIEKLRIKAEHER